MSAIVGIDLGTTHSLVAAVIGAEPRLLADDAGAVITPSVVAYPPAAEAPLVGTAALAESHWDYAAYSIKRLMGRGLEDVAAIRHLLPFDLGESTAELIRVRLGDRALTPIELSGMILSRLKAVAERALAQPVSHAVITVPAYFNDAQRQATVAAARWAGLSVMRLVNEPTAACLAYGLQHRQDGLFAVYDLGGGTFDVSILRVEDGVFEVLATCGDTTLGGDDLDRALMAVIHAQVQAATGIDLLAEPLAAMRLRWVAKQAKEALSSQEATEVPLQLPDGRQLALGLAREDLERLARPMLEQTLAACRQALADAGLGPDALDAVVLVGGATRMPLVKAMVGEFFGRTPDGRLDPDAVVALGAAIQADILAGKRDDLLLLDVVPLSLGLETLGGGVEKLIARNSPVPTSAAEQFTTLVDHQTSVDLHVVQGERELASDNRSLARFAIKIPAQPAGAPRIQVKFAVDANGLLTVTAIDEHTGTRREVEVRPSFGLAPEEVEAMVASAQAHADEDAETRALLAARRKARELVAGTEKALEHPAVAEVDPDVLEMIAVALGQLRLAAETGDEWFIRECIEKLDHMTQDLAGLIMGSALTEAQEQP